MDTKFEFDQEHELLGEERIVYIRPVAVEDLPEDIQEQAAGLKQLV